MARVEHEELEPSADYLLMMYEDLPFTGIAIETAPGGHVLAEVEYRDGQRHGYLRRWSPSGVLVCEQENRFGAVHGVLREWYESGQPKSESTYEFGVLLAKREWNENGDLQAEFTLDERSPEFGIVESLRKGTFADANAPPKH